MQKIIIVGLIVFIIVVGFYVVKQNSTNTQAANSTKESTKKPLIISGNFNQNGFKTNEEWKKILTPNQYAIMRESGTENPYTGKLLDNKKEGYYTSPGCNKPLFSSLHKYNSNTGWPSFYQALDQNSVVLKKDTELLGEERVEVLDTCGNHLGHVFNDGPQPTGKRFCINSGALIFVPKTN